MKKGVSGHTLVIVISLIVAMIGLVILWLFVWNTEQEGENFITEIMASLKSMIPASIRWILPGV